MNYNYVATCVLTIFIQVNTVLAMDFGYTMIGEDSVTICSTQRQDAVMCHLSDSNGVLRLPSVINEKSVSAISKDAFKNRLDIQEIVLPSSICEIGSGAFENCEALRSVVVQSYTSEIKRSLIVRSRAFANCLRLEKLELGDGVVAIGDEAFFCCKKLAEFSLSCRLERIGLDAFLGCDGLRVVRIPEQTNIDIQPDFRVCCGLSSFEVSPSNRVYCSFQGALFDKRMKALLIYPKVESSAMVSLPSGVECIAPWAFADCAGVQQIELPSTLNVIEDGAFACSGLVELQIPDGVDKIPSRMCMGCKNLKTVSLPRLGMELASDAFPDAKEKAFAIVFRR